MALVPVQPIAAGYACGYRLTFAGGIPLFPAGAALRADVRDYAGSPSTAGILTTASGTATVVDPWTIELFLAPAITGALARRTCAVDLARTDVAPAIWLGVQLIMPVVTTVTRSPGDALAPDRIVAGDASVLASILTPPGVSVVVTTALGVPPWSSPQIVLTSAFDRVAQIPAPLVSRLPASIVSPPSIPAAPSPLAPVLTQPPQPIFAPPPGVATIVGSPIVVTGGAVVVGPAAIVSALVVLKPAIGSLPAVAVDVPAATASGLVPSPTVSQPSSSRYVAAGYVAPGYYGAN